MINDKDVDYENTKTLIQKDISTLSYRGYKTEDFIKLLNGYLLRNSHINKEIMIEGITGTAQKIVHDTINFAEKFKEDIGKPYQTEDTIKNNGGATDYYDLPKPDPIDIADLIGQYANNDISVTDCVISIIELFPKTLNDLIEFKKMQPYQHEIMKATYALNERAKKNGGSALREINKIIYYAIRGRNLITKEGDE